MEYWVILVVILLAAVFFLRTKRVTPTIQGIYVYPVKSCAGIRVSQAKVALTGLAFDRMWAFLDREGHQVTARDDPRLWNIHPSLDLLGDPQELTLTYEGKSVTIGVNQTVGPTFTMTKFKTTAEVRETGAETTAWIQTTLNRDYRLCKVVEPQPSEISSDVHINLPDYGQILIASNASLAAVIREVPEPKKGQLAMTCFRPNVVVEGCGAWTEDTWASIRIGDLVFRAAGPCDRCKMTTIDPRSLAFDDKTEPLPTLRKIHGKGIKAFFGQWFTRTQSGVIRIGDPIQVLESKTFPN